MQRCRLREMCLEMVEDGSCTVVVATGDDGIDFFA